MGVLGAIPNPFQRDDGPKTMRDGINHRGAHATAGRAAGDEYRVDPLRGQGWG